MNTQKTTHTNTPTPPHTHHKGHVHYYLTQGHVVTNVCIDSFNVRHPIYQLVINQLYIDQLEIDQLEVDQLEFDQVVIDPG